MDEILARAGIFQGVDPTAVSALTKQLQPVDFPRGHTVFSEGEPGDRLYIILTGKVKIGRRSPDGRENLLTIMGPSDMFGELSIFDPGPRTSSATRSPEAKPARWASRGGYAAASPAAISASPEWRATSEIAARESKTVN